MTVFAVKKHKRIKTTLMVLSLPLTYPLVTLMLVGISKVMEAVS